MSERVEILRGHPTPEEVAAVALAVARMREQDAARRLVPVEPAWLVAARRESVGGRPAAAPADLQPYT